MSIVLETEKENDAAEKVVEELKRQLQPKRARSDADAGDDHEILSENRRNVQVGSRINQQQPHPDKDGFLLHTRLGLVGWIAYWCCGDAALAVFILVAFIKTGLTFQEWDPYRVLTTQAIRWQCSSTRVS
jgi:hypothetical protein